MPTYYSLNSARIGGANGLQTWELQGSNDEKNWDTLTKHKDDFNLENDRSTPTSWVISGCHVAYRYFRVWSDAKQEGSVLDGVCLLSVGGFEIYGIVHGVLNVPSKTSAISTRAVNYVSEQTKKCMLS
jgi:hypothetical protein